MATFPVFGEVRFCGGLWESNPLDGSRFPFLVTVVADESGPSQDQVRLFEDILTQLPELLERCKIAILHQNDFAEIGIDQLGVFGINLPDNSKCKKIEFEIVTGSEESTIIYNVRFLGFFVAEVWTEDLEG